MAAGSAILSAARGAAAAAEPPSAAPAEDDRGRAPRGYLPVVTPDVTTLPWKERQGTKVFHLIAGEFDREFAPGLDVKIWGYNGHTPGPTIEVVEGDRCRFYVNNRLPEPTTVHWHGIRLPNGMDGVSGLTQAPIPPGETGFYEFTFTTPGTFMYHSHFDEMVQIALGMMGMIVVHPRRPTRKVDRDYCLMLNEWLIRPGSSRPDPSAMSDFNILTFNGKAFPGTTPLLAETGDLVRIRIGNLSPMDHHPIHIHGHAWKVVETDGGPIPPAGQWPETTVLVPTGSTRVVEFIADNPGDWAMHCHMTHHIMNQMGHGLPNLIGVDVRGLDERTRAQLPEYMTMGQNGMGGMGEMGMRVPRNTIPMKGGPGRHGYIDMGGMFTIVKIRDQLNGNTDPGWYEAPAGTQARLATPEEMKRDGIERG
jgi:FtsP/CotA-like multicopper oxidase with cupredoxin domain